VDFVYDVSADAAAADCEVYSLVCDIAVRTADADADVDETAVSVSVSCSPLSLVGSQPSDDYFRSLLVCLFVCLCRVFLSRL